MTKYNSAFQPYLVLFICLFSLIGYSQSTYKTEIDSVTQTQSKWKFGMGFGLNFVGGTNISLAPNLNYIVSNKVTFAVGLQYNYLAIKDIQKTSTIGGTIATLFSPVKNLTTILEFAELKVTTKRETLEGQISNDFWDSALFIGAGVNVTKKIILGAKYNLLYNEDESVYSSAIIPFVNITF